MTYVLRIGVEIVEKRTDAWCRDCQQATGFRMTIATTQASQTKVVTQAACVECGGENVAAA